MEQEKLTNILQAYTNSDGHKGFHFWCPGCNSIHGVTIKGDPKKTPIWGWNKSEIEPTFTPSIKVTFPANPGAEERFKEWRKKRICHSYVTDGKIRFLGDSWHELKNQTVPLPPTKDWWPKDE